MDTNRIGQFLGLTPKLANPIDSAPQKGGFADLLFGVMSNRIGTAKPGSASPLARVSTILPFGNDVATSRAAVASPPSSSPAIAPRDHQVASGKRGNEVAAAASTRHDAAKLDTSGAATPVAARVAGGAKAGASNSGAIEDAGGTAPMAENAEIGDDTQDEVELQADAEDADAQDSGHGQEGVGQEEAGQPSDQQAQAAAIDPQAAMSDNPDLVASIGQPAAADITIAPTTEDVVAPVTSGKDAQPDQKQPTMTAPALASDADQALPAEAEDAAPDATAGQITDQQADGETAIIDGAATDTDTAAAALALVEDPLKGDAEAAAQATALARQAERRAEDDGAGLFRRSNQAARQRTSTTGTGATGPSAQPAASTVNTAAIPGSSGAGAGTPTPVLLPLAPLGFETGFNGTPGLPGWTLNLAQGAAANRPEFIANLRQHLQNLPAHEQLALGIQRTARDGSGRITLQLSPSELGRIHVRLDIDDEKNVRASVSVERPGTLELLQRDTKALERALQDAGLKMDQGDLSFSLQGDDGESFAQEFGSGSDDLAQMMADAVDSDLAAELAAQQSVVATGDGLVDVQI